MSTLHTCNVAILEGSEKLLVSGNQNPVLVA